MTFAEAKDQVATDNGYTSWAHLVQQSYRHPTHILYSYFDKAAELYAASVREEAEPKWIPVTERLPEPGDRFISVGVLTISPNLPTGIVTAHYDYSYNHWTHRGDVIGVTHWMEIPKLKLTAPGR